LEDPRQDELDQARRYAAKDGCDCEDDDGSAKHRAGAKAIGDPTADRNEDRQRNEIGRDTNAEMRRAYSERERHLWQSSCDRCPIEVLHKERNGHDERDQLRSVRRFLIQKLVVQ